MLTHGIRPPEWIATAPIQTSASIDIAASPEVVWGFLADHEAWSDWFAVLDRVIVTGAPSGVGGSRRVVLQGLPFDEEFTAWDEPHRIAWAVTGSRLPILSAMAESVQLEPIEGGCRLVMAQGLQARQGFGRVLGPMWRRNLPGIREALETLRDRVESASA